MLFPAPDLLAWPLRSPSAVPRPAPCRQPSILVHLVRPCASSCTLYVLAPCTLACLQRGCPVLLCIKQGAKGCMVARRQRPRGAWGSVRVGCAARSGEQCAMLQLFHVVLTKLHGRRRSHQIITHFHRSALSPPPSVVLLWFPPSHTWRKAGKCLPCDPGSIKLDPRDAVKRRSCLVGDCGSQGLLLGLETPGTSCSCSPAALQALESGWTRQRGGSSHFQVKS